LQSDKDDIKLEQLIAQFKIGDNTDFGKSFGALHRFRHFHSRIIDIAVNMWYNSGEGAPVRCV